MPLRLAHFVLASLLLFAQMASPVMQLCQEEDGSVSMEFAGVDCGAKNPAFDSCENANLDSTPADNHPCDLMHEDDCPCLDFGLALVLNVNKDWSPAALDLPSALPVELPNACLSSWEGTPTDLVPANGQLSSPWLEHADVLAKNHAAHAVVMRV
ncbi:MAG: hypothetical protein COA70_01200 [Planctomycetota bacterium]|nr:MAG: hypothetical protein COA70_01200 [Planctomycetota bacterium]